MGKITKKWYMTPKTGPLKMGSYYNFIISVWFTHHSIGNCMGNNLVGVKLQKSDIWPLKWGHITTSPNEGGSHIFRLEIAWRLIIWHLKCNMTPLGGFGGSYYYFVIIFVMHVRNTDICMANCRIWLIL